MTREEFASKSMATIEWLDELTTLADKADRIHREIREYPQPISERRVQIMIADWDDMACRLRLLKRKYLAGEIA